MPAVDPCADPAIDHRVRAFLKQLNSSGGAPLEQLPLADARAVLVNLQMSVTVDLPPALVSTLSINQAGQKVDLTVVRPAGERRLIPVFMFFHGGGWVLGDFPTHERLVRDLVVGSGAAAVFVNYTPSPEAQYPDGHQPGLCRHEMGGRVWSRNQRRRPAAGGRRQ